jgi:hypothetical protein
MKLFLNKTNINNDIDYLNCKDNQNLKSEGYYLKNFSSDKKLSKSRNISINQPTFQVIDGKGWINKSGDNIDIDSNFRNSDNLTNKNIINQLNPRHIITTPYKQSRLDKKINLESQLRPALRKNIQKRVDKLIDYDFTENIFNPSVKNNKMIQEDICNDWIRGGDSSRNNINNPKYLRKMGYKYNGKFWEK